MKLTPPFALKDIDNPFGPTTEVDYESVDGTIGHPGVDFNEAWGTPIPCAIAGSVVSALLSDNNPDLMAFRAVNTIYEDPSGVYEIQYGHVSTMNVAVGQVLKAGDIVAHIGNTGDVFAVENGKAVEITEAQKAAGSHAGSHLHFQVRVLEKIPASTPNDPNLHYLNDGSGQLVLNGFKYAVPNFNNGYNGCVDPMMFFDGGLEDVVKSEVATENTITDPAVKSVFMHQIIAGAEKLLGITT